MAPFLWLISTSLKTNDQIVQAEPAWIPRPATLQNYLHAFNTVPLLEYGKNTLIVTLFSVFGALCSPWWLMVSLASNGGPESSFSY
jgi:multiple sugar transport system permease protein